MVSIIILIIIIGIIAAVFYRKAVDNKRNPYVWAVIGLFSAFIVPTILLKIIILVNHGVLQEFFLVVMGYVVLSFVCVCVTYYILEKLSKPIIINHYDDDLLDSDLDR